MGKFIWTLVLLLLALVAWLFGYGNVAFLLSGWSLVTFVLFFQEWKYIERLQTRLLAILDESPNTDFNVEKLVRALRQQDQITSFSNVRLAMVRLDRARRVDSWESGYGEKARMNYRSKKRLVESVGAVA